MSGGRLHDALLILWIALISADRIDLAGGAAPFILTPFLVLTPLVLLSETLRIRLRGAAPRLTTGIRRYAAVALGLLAVAVVSAFLGRVPETAMMRAAHLSFLVLTTLAVAVTLSAHPDWRGVLVRGAKAALAVAAVFSVVQVFAFLGSEGTPFRIATVTVDLRPGNYAGFIPRLSGVVGDQNRAGLLYLFCLFVLVRWGRPGAGRQAWIALIAVLLLATLSRSALLGVTAMGMVAWLDRPRVRVSPAAALAGAAIVGLFLVWLLLNPVGRAEMVQTLEPLAGRLSLEEGSTRSHLALLGRGVEIGSSSVRNAVLGVGYGNAYVVLQDFFPGNKYGNFHSLYVTMFAESGIFALLLTLLLVGYPLVRGGPFRPLIAGVVFLNVFYQFAADPLFWLILAMAWLVVGRGLEAEEAPTPVREPVHRPLRTLALLALTAASAGCADWIVDTIDYGSIEVRTVRRSGEPVPDAYILLFSGLHQEAEGFTDADGRQLFEFVPPGRYGVRVRPPEGWTWPEVLTADPVKDFVDGIAMEEGDRRELTFTLMKRGPGSVEVLVRGPDGEGVPGAILDLFRPLTDFTASGTTGQEGRFVFDPVPFGRYGVQIRAPEGHVTEDGGTTAVVEGILVEEGVTESVSFDLRRAQE